MRLFLLSLIFNFILIGFCTAQVRQPSTAYTGVGLKGGSSFSSFSFDPSENQGWATGYTAGLLLKHAVRVNENEPMMGIQVELNWVQRGWSDKIDSATTYTRSLHYIELPFMTHAIWGHKNTKYLANFGPAISYLVSNRDSIPAISDKEHDGYYQNEIEKPWLVGLTLGAGLQHTSALGTLQLEARITQSLNNIMTKRQQVVSARNTNITITLAYLLELRPK
ncbi:PorT family protein [Pontibacter sp. HSC-14F20]|uniref:porin family protein n=1 Tax=Pontibacter sp. HSC-14F20 TaxID=2864136 RepID=UPI001C72D36F|nr:porin family protein [Pontibacter sp. HSC-14F20]MBX0332336.1 PorT family protein [Pontibacter sp. HSC-14F20]